MRYFLDKISFRKLSSLEDILDLSPKAFEYFSKFILEQQGYERVRVTTKKGTMNADGGVDIHAALNNEITYVQCKRWRDSDRGGYMPVENIRALGGSMLRDNITKGIFISTLPYSKTAIREAQDMNISLIGPQEITEEMKRINPKFGKKRFSLRKLLWKRRQRSRLAQELFFVVEPLLWMVLFLICYVIYEAFL